MLQCQVCSMSNVKRWQHLGFPTRSHTLHTAHCLQRVVQGLGIVHITDLLYLWLDLWKEVGELDVCREEEASGGGAAQVELGVQKLELHRRTATDDHWSVSGKARDAGSLQSQPDAFTAVWAVRQEMQTVTTTRFHFHWSESGKARDAGSHNHTLSLWVVGAQHTDSAPCLRAD